MKGNNPKPMKVDPEFKRWLEQRQANIKRAIKVPVKVTMMDTQRIIAKTDGVNITEEMVRKMWEKKKR